MVRCRGRPAWSPGRRSFLRMLVGFNPMVAPEEHRMRCWTFCLLIGLGGLLWADAAGAQVRMINKCSIVSEPYYAPVQRTYTSWRYDCRPVNRTYTRTSYRIGPKGSLVPSTETYVITTYDCRYEPVTYTSTTYELRYRTHHRCDMVAIPDTKVLTDQLDLIKGMDRDRRAMEATVANMAADIHKLFQKNRLTEDLQASSESLGEERFLESFSTWSLARAVHVAR